MGDILRCDAKERSGACKGGPLDEGICTGIREGRLCSVCPKGFQTVEPDGCETCDALYDVLRIIVMFVVMVIVIFLLHRLGNVSDTQERLSQLASVAAVGMLAQFIQTLVVFKGINIKWGEPFQSVLDTFSIFQLNFEVLRMQCVVSQDPIVSFLSWMCMPIVAMILLVL